MSIDLSLKDEILNSLAGSIAVNRRGYEHLSGLILPQCERRIAVGDQRWGEVRVNFHYKGVLIFRDVPQFVALARAYWLYLLRRAGIL